METVTIPLENIRIVLVEPAGPRNVGAIARVMKNMGFKHLYLVNPQCDPVCDEARYAAVHAQDLLESAQQVDSLPAALQGCFRAIATTGRQRDIALNLEPPQHALPWLLAEPSALIFGRENSGLTTAELNYAQRYVAVPTNPDYPSLNLAQAVGVCTYELRRHLLFASEVSTATSEPNHPLPIAPPTSPTASLEILEGYFEHLESFLRATGYLYPHTASSRMAKFRQIYKRAHLSANEVALLRGILSRVEWILKNR